MVVLWLGIIGMPLDILLRLAELSEVVRTQSFPGPSESGVFQLVLQVFGKSVVHTVPRGQYTPKKGFAEQVILILLQSRQVQEASSFEGQPQFWYVWLPLPQPLH